MKRISFEVQKRNLGTGLWHTKFQLTPAYRYVRVKRRFLWFFTRVVDQIVGKDELDLRTRAEAILSAKMFYHPSPGHPMYVRVIEVRQTTIGDVRYVIWANGKFLD